MILEKLKFFSTFDKTVEDDLKYEKTRRPMNGQNYQNTPGLEIWETIKKFYLQPGFNPPNLIS